MYIPIGNILIILERFIFIYDFPFRLVRFDGFLNRVPYSNQSKGFGGSCQLPLSELGLATNRLMGPATHENNDDIEEESYNKALVQRIILLVLKSVALTTREAR